MWSLRFSYNYGYDANKNVTSETNTRTVMNCYNGTTSFDNLDRVTSWNRTKGDNQAWTLDKIGNWGNTSGSIENTYIVEIWIPGKIQNHF